ncbi:hypothetical protein BH23ACT9_BH23ACT9_11230 [soil metagenome]
MANPQQPELRRSEQTPSLTPDAIRAELDAHDRPEKKGNSGPAPKANKPGTASGPVQDKPNLDDFAAKFGMGEEDDEESSSSDASSDSSSEPSAVADTAGADTDGAGTSGDAQQPTAEEVTTAKTTTKKSASGRKAATRASTMSKDTSATTGKPPAQTAPAKASSGQASKSTAKRVSANRKAQPAKQATTNPSPVRAEVTASDTASDTGAEQPRAADGFDLRSVRGVAKLALGTVGIAAGAAALVLLPVRKGAKRLAGAARGVVRR